MPPLPSDYQTLTADAKRGLLWQNLLADEYADDALPNISYPAFVARATVHGLFSVRFLRQTFEHMGDELPAGRKKIVHPYGTVCQVRWEAVPENPFTGVLRTGGIGLIRIGLSLPARSFTPGMGLKILVGGHPSRNVVCIPNLEGQGADANVFARPCSTILPPFSGLVLGAVKIMFTKAVKQIPSRGLSWNKIPVNHLAETESDGAPVANPVIPDELVFQPTADAQTSSAPTPDYRLKLKAIPPGTALYDISARATEGGALQPIGRLITESRFVASRYGDEVLFFQHNTGLVKGG
ncbi:MAG: hypothetical protein ACKV0T_05025 [Planctomycetales bacterium]